MENRSLNKSLYLISQPYSLIAIAILLINDHVLKIKFPSWWTGKLSDIAWLYLLPILTVMVFSITLPSKWVKEKTIGWVTYGLISLCFILTKTIEPINATVNLIFSWISGLPVNSILDPTDLLALIGLLISYLIWTRIDPSIREKHSILYFSLPLAIMAIMASSPIIKNPGITCLSIINGQIRASSFSSSFESSDGGITWEKVEPPEDCTITIYKDEGYIKNGIELYRYRPEQKIEHTIDGGKTWEEEFNLKPLNDVAVVLNKRLLKPIDAYTPGPFSGVIDTKTGNAIFAMGQQGVLVKKVSGEWIFIPVGNYRFVEVSSYNRIITIINTEYILALIIVFLLMNFLLYKWIHPPLLTFNNLISPLALFIMVITFNPLENYDSLSPMLRDGSILLLFQNISFATYGFYTVKSLPIKNKIFIAGISLSAGIFFFLPYFFWVFSVIPFLYEANLYSIILSIAHVFLGVVYVEKLNNIQNARNG